VAEMPSAGRIMRMSIAGVVAAASMGVAASSASAKDVWLWSCHGPNGKATSTPGNGTELGGRVEAVNGGCAGDSTTAGLKLRLTGEGSASLVVTMPEQSGLNAKAIKVRGTAAGLSAANVTLTANGTPVNPASLAAPVALNPNGTVTLKLSCSSECSGSPELTVYGIGLLAADDSAPRGGSNWSSPVDHEMKVSPSYTDTGAGLDRAEISIPGYPNRTRSVSFGACNDLSPNSADNDRPLNPVACPNGTSQGTGPGGAPLPLAAKTVTLQVWQDVYNATTKQWTLDPLRLPEGLFKPRVTIYDAAGNTTVEQRDVEVWHPVLPSDTQELRISTASVTELPGPNVVPPAGDGGVQGAQSSQCRSPRLSVILRSKPVRVSKRVPVLKYKKRYRFTGRLTCVINGKRQSAPKRTKLAIYNKVGKKTVRKPNTAIRAKGKVDLKLAFVSSRTVIFRYTNAGGQKSEVKIKIRITKKSK
jgi:hypothetical protein